MLLKFDNFEKNLMRKWKTYKFSEENILAFSSQQILEAKKRITKSEILLNKDMKELKDLFNFSFDSQVVFR